MKHNSGIYSSNIAIVHYQGRNLVHISGAIVILF